MKKCYVLFDQLPSIEDGGLIVTYVNMLPFLEKEYEIHIISIFNCRQKVKNEKIFNKYELHIMNDIVIDNRFPHIFDYLKEGQLFFALFAFFSMLVYFLSAPFVRWKLRNLISCDSLVIASCPAAAMFMCKKVPFILDIHTEYEYFFGENLIGRLQTLLMRKPNLTIFRNKLDAEKGSKHFPSDYLYHFVPEVCSATKKNIERKKNKILFVGRLHEHKNPLRLLKIAKELKNSGVDFELDIYGTGLLEKLIEEKINELNLQDKVFLRGFLQDKTLMSNYDLLWMTSSLEGFGLVLIEAKANGVPSISVEWGKAVYEVINNNVDGYIVENDDLFVEKTKYLLENKEILNEFSERAYKDYIERFSEENYKKCLFSIIHRFTKEYLESTVEE